MCKWQEYFWKLHEQFIVYKRKHSHFESNNNNNTFKAKGSFLKKSLYGVLLARQNFLSPPH